MSSRRPRPWRWVAALCGLRLLIHLVVRAAHGGFTFLLSPTELARVQAAADWAKTPSFAPYGGTYWLPLQFALEGSLLRLWPRPLDVTFTVSTCCALLTIAGVFILAFELAGLEAALAAGAACVLSATGVVLGVGGSADPLLHAGAIWGLVFWARFERGGERSGLWKGGVCLTLAGLARFEAWPVAVAAAAALLWKRGRRAWPAAAWALLPAACWAAYCFHATGDPLSFLRQTLAADILKPGTPLEIFRRFCLDFLWLVPAWLLALLLAAAAGFVEAPSVAWAAVGALGACFILPSPWIMTQVDEHPWIVTVLALPLAGAALAAVFRSLDRRKRAVAWLAVAVAYASTQAANWSDYSAYFTRLHGSAVGAFLAVRGLREGGRLAASDAVLVELPEDRRSGAYYALWPLEDPNALFDRRLDYGPVSSRELVIDGNPSRLDGESVASMRAKGVRVIVAGARRERLRAAGLVEFSSSGPLSVLVWPDDALAQTR